MKQRQLFSIVLIFTIALIAGCQKAPSIALVDTTTLIIRCDSEFNDDMRLPIELVYVPIEESIGPITEVGADEWFDSDKRDQWAYKQSLSLVPGEKKKFIVPLDRPSQTVAVIIIADYKDIKDAKGQVVVLNSDAKIQENIFVTANGLLH